MDLNRNNRFKILIVDDVPKNIQVAASILQSDSYHIAFAQDGPTALSQVESNRFDLILLDIMMPQMDGFEVLERLKGNPDTAGIPVIMLTARKSREDMEKARNLGAVEYITKPFKAIEVVDKVLRHVGQS